MRRRYWQCCKSQDLDLEESDGLKKTVLETPHMNALWTRGILTQAFMESLVDEENPEPNAETWWEKEGTEEALTAHAGQTLHIFTDASGGKSISSPLLRRVGWGFAVAATKKATPLIEDGQMQYDQLRYVAEKAGNLGQEQHTVGRGELIAAREALRCTNGDTIVYPD